MLGNVVAISASSGAAQRSTTSTAERTGGKVVPDARQDVARLDLDKAVQQLNIASLSIGRALRFQVDRITGDSIILVYDRETGDLIRQIPPEDVKFTFSKINGASYIQLLDDMA